MTRVLISLIIGLLLTACQTTSSYEGSPLQYASQFSSSDFTINGIRVSP